MYGLPGAVISSAAFVLVWRFVRTLDGRSLSPVGIYVVRWWLLVVLYCLNPLGYPTLSGQAWFAVASAVLFFLLGYLVVRRKRLVTTWEGVAAKLGPVPPRLWLAIRLVFLAGLALYALYAIQVALRFGLLAIVLGPHQLRLSIANGDVPLGFHYLYLFEMVPALTVLVARRFVPTARQARWLVLMGGVATVALLGTTARTNVFKALVWAGVVYLYTSRPRRFDRRVAALVTAGVVALMFLFTAIGNNLGKTYENSVFGSGAVAVPEWFRPLALPYHYNAAELPTLDAMLHDPELEHRYGLYTLNPMASVLALAVPDLDVPSHIGKFYSNPYPFNVATQLDVFVRDFGLIGVPVGSFFLGLLAGVITRLFARRPADWSALLLLSWMAMILNASTGAAAFAKVSYLVQLALILALRRFSKSRQRVIRTSPVLSSATRVS